MVSKDDEILAHHLGDAEPLDKVDAEFLKEANDERRIKLAYNYRDKMFEIAVPEGMSMTIHCANYGEEILAAGFHRMNPVAMWGEFRNPPKRKRKPLLTKEEDEAITRLRIHCATD